MQCKTSGPGEYLGLGNERRHLKGALEKVAGCRGRKVHGRAAGSRKGEGSEQWDTRHPGGLGVVGWDKEDQDKQVSHSLCRLSDTRSASSV